MNERDNKKEHELWFKNEFPDDYLLFIHDSSREALIKFINSEKSWQASANRGGYKLVPLEPTQSMIDNAVDKTPETPSQDYWHCSQPISDDQAVECYKAMIGVVDEST